MTTQQSTTQMEYNPFHHLQDLHYVLEQGDGILRLAFLEAMDKLDVEYGPYLTALEVAAFPAKLALTMYARLIPEGERPATAEFDNFTFADIEHWMDYMVSRLNKNVAVKHETYSDEEGVYSLSFADQERVLNAIAEWTDKQVVILLQGYDGDAEYKKAEKLCNAVVDQVTETFSIKGFGADAVTLHQGGTDPYPLRVRQISKETGKFHMTRNGLKEWGLVIPKQPDLPDNTNVAVNIYYPNVPDDVMLKVTSSTDDVPDGEGGTKSEQLTISIKKGDNTMQLSLLNKNLRQHSWTFSIEEVA